MAGLNEFNKLPEGKLACVPPEVSRFLKLLARNDQNVLAPVQQIFEAIFGDNLTNIVNGGNYAENFDTIVGRAVGGTKRIQLTGNMTTQTAQAKLYEWNGSAYVAVGSAFTIYDTFDRWSHAKTNDTGFIVWDVDREVFAVVWLSTPMTRRGTLAAALGRDENKDMTDADDSSTVSVNGYFVPTGKKIPSGSRVKADYNVLAKKWYVDTTDVCVVPV